MRSLIWIVTSCAEKLAGYEEYRSLYLLFRIGSTGVIESFYVPVDKDYVELGEPFVKCPEYLEPSEARMENLELRLAYSYEIQPLV